MHIAFNRPSNVLPLTLLVDDSFVFQHENFSIIILGCVFLPSIKEKPWPDDGDVDLVRLMSTQNSQ